MIARFKRAMRTVLTSLVLAAAPAIGSAQEAWPTKPITLVVTYPPGGGADLMARIVAPKMSEVLGQPIVVDNKPGAAGQIGAAFVAKAKPDGYTVMVDAASFVINQSLYPKLPYDAERAFKPVGVLAVFPHVIVVTPGYEAKSVADLIAIAKGQPGKINYASSGTGSAQHLAGAAFVQQAKIDLTHVPYKGGAPAMNDVMGGHIPVFFANVASGLSHLKSGKLRALAVAGERRIAALPDTPTLAELGMQGSEVYDGTACSSRRAHLTRSSTAWPMRSGRRWTPTTSSNGSRAWGARSSQADRRKRPGSSPSKGSARRRSSTRATSSRNDPA